MPKKDTDARDQAQPMCAELGAALISLARRCIEWHTARDEGGVVTSTEGSGLTYGSALTIRRHAQRLGVWPEDGS